MSITKDFEKLKLTNSNGLERSTPVYKASHVKQLLAHARSIKAQNEELKAEVERLSQCFDHQTGVASRAIEEISELKAMLRKHWVAVSEVDGSPYCPECYEQGWDSHTPDCALAKLIGE